MDEDQNVPVRRGRPRQATAKRRSLVVRLTDHDVESIRQRARRHGVSVSTYVRTVLNASGTDEVISQRLGPNNAGRAAGGADAISPAQTEKSAGTVDADEPDDGMYDKGRTRRREIVARALDAFSQLGFDHVSVRDIAHQCGMSHQALMHYFPSKTALIRAALELRDERLVHRFTESVSVHDLVGLAADNATHPGHVAMFNTAAAEASAPDHTAHEYYASFYRSLVSALARGMHEESDMAFVDARLFLAMMDGLQLQWLYEPGAFSVAELLQQGADRLGIDAPD